MPVETAAHFIIELSTTAAGRLSALPAVIFGYLLPRVQELVREADRLGRSRYSRPDTLPSFAALCYTTIISYFRGSLHRFHTASYIRPGGKRC